MSKKPYSLKKLNKMCFGAKTHGSGLSARIWEEEM